MNPFNPNQGRGPQQPQQPGFRRPYPSYYADPNYNQQQAQAQYPLQQNYINGRVINSPDDVTANEVSMDGTVSLFPTSDYNAIYAKAWTPEGTIMTVKFVPEQTPNLVVGNKDNPIQASTDAILARLDNIEKMLAKRNKPYNNNRNQQKLPDNKKEVKNDE